MCEERDYMHICSPLCLTGVDSEIERRERERVQDILIICMYVCMYDEETKKEKEEKKNTK